jgi:ferredoxin
LLFCARNAEGAPFLAELQSYGGEIRLHESQSGTRLDVAAALPTHEAGTLLYCCGPASLMNDVEAATAHWPVGSVHFEWFAPREQAASNGAETFAVVCAQSGITVTVPAGESILGTLDRAGIVVPSSCEQGICGTCECRVLEGEVEHRDSILSAAERAAGETMMICVSRARGARLVLDI